MGKWMMKNLKLTKKEIEQAEQEQRIKKRKKGRLIIISIIIVLLFVAWQGVKQYNQLTAELDSYKSNATDKSGQTMVNEVSTDSYQIAKIFLTNLFSLESSFFIKFLIFLGVIYLFQITFALALDILEVALVIFVAIKRIVVWIYKKVKKE